MGVLEVFAQPGDQVANGSLISLSSFSAVGNLMGSLMGTVALAPAGACHGVSGGVRAAQTGPSPRSLLDDLKRASLANDPQATRQALDAWARQQPETLADMAARFVPLSDALDGLNGALYSETGQYWQGEELWKAIRSIPATEREQDAASEPSSLPPLYPK